MALRRRPRKSVKRRRTVVYESSPPRVTRQSYVAPTPPRRESELEKKAKDVAVKFLEVAERDPEGFIRGLEHTVSGIERLYQIYQQNPEGAKKATRNALLSAAARLARRRLGGG